jgi:hypothetical protein
MSFGGFGGFGQNTQQSSGFGAGSGFGSTTSGGGRSCDPSLCCGITHIPPVIRDLLVLPRLLGISIQDYAGAS